MDPQISSLRSLLAGGGTQTMAAIGVAPFLVLLGVALTCSLFIGYLYGHFLGSRATGHSLHRAFPLLGLSMTALFVAVQFSLPLSLGLLAALTIVRFRTPVKEPEEVGFVMLVVAAAVATATFRLAFAGILLLVAVVALAWQGRLRTGAAADGVLVVTLPAAEQAQRAADLTALVGSALGSQWLTSVSQAGSQTVLSYTFRATGPDPIEQLRSSVQRTVPNAKLSVFLNRPERE